MYYVIPNIAPQAETTDQSPPRTIYSAEDFREGGVAYCTPAPRVLKRPLSKDAKRCQERGRPAWASRGLPHSRKDLTAAEKRIVRKVHQNLKAMLDPPKARP